MSDTTHAQPHPLPASDRAFAFLLGLHGLAFMVVFPFGPQATRLWHPGLTGIATLAASFPLAAVLGGLAARRATRLPASPRTLAALAGLATLPALFSVGYGSLVSARLLGGFATGVSYVALHRAAPAAPSAPGLAAIAPRVIAFGMPLCLLAATAFDWRAAFVPLLLGQSAIWLFAPRQKENSPDAPALTTREALHEPAPAALVATAALAFVSGAYLTVLSGFLVFDAGQTEWHIPACLLAGAMMGLGVSPALAGLRVRLAPARVYAVSLAVSAVVLVALLALRSPLPAMICVPLIGAFLATNSARHLALSFLVRPRLAAASLAAHQTHTHLAHHLGSGLGALGAGLIIGTTSQPASAFAGMETLLAVGLAATALALAAGVSAAQPSAWPAACAAAAKSPFRVAASVVRFVRTSTTRSPGAPT